ncbi:ATP-binding protein [Fibrisoma montanum]|uniref:ATP-binding protein n=1 Tax=Fibrisoma montanum TaxID=2305895 RepID=A0A418M407_9BACT|nr:P-loop NTPase fold protein [Fibrisoma montanum]RIV20502.1 ATP-binding protein [Fibrisoma montanum]
MKLQLRQRVLTLLKQLIRRIESIPSTSVSPPPFAPLTPINSVENKKYGEAIQWALSQPHDKRIHNVALTGPYGSGKSSVIRTFELDYGGFGYEFLNISLATFRDDQQPAKTLTTEHASLVDLNRIEASILQQLFYREDDASIPDSRFKKIKHYSRSTRVFSALAICGWLLSFYAIGFPDSFAKQIKNMPSYTWLTYLEVPAYVPMLIFLAGIAWAVYKGIRLLARIRLNKINVFEAELEIDALATPSILNQHLDEIIYFFKKTVYNVVVIEDLDRFNQPEIFTKLREINTILNDSKTIGRKIVFLYAVRDDMFNDKDRAKFFDFIIPIIPVINYSNSSEKLLSISNANNYGWYQPLIDDIALFIDDMRLLYNVTNEFYLYNASLHPSLDKNKLLALLVYKNCYPSDFVALSQGQGVLYGHFQKKQTLIKSTISTIESEIKEKEEELRILERVALKDEHELKSVYLLKVIESIGGFQEFQHKYYTYSIQQVVEEKFNLLVENELQYNYNGYNRNLPKKFEVIEKEVDPTQSFQQRLATINAKNNKAAKNLSIDIQALETQKRSCQEATFKELLTNTTNELFTDESRQSMFLSLMLRTGYIDESYLDYVSIFYEGSLSRNDYDFLLAVKTRRPKAFDLPLTNLEKILSKLSLTDFSHPACYNLSLLDYMLGKGRYTSQLNYLFATFATESEASIQFLLALLQKPLQPRYLLPALVQQWPNCWRFIETSLQVSAADKEAFYILLVEHVPTKQIINLNAATSIGQYLVDKPELLYKISAKGNLKSLITDFDLQFITLYETLCPDDLIEFIYTGSHYEINDFMIALLVKKKGKYDPVAFAQRNFSALLDTGLTSMIAYINANREAYVTEVFLTLPENRHELETTLLTLLNDDSLRLPIKQQILTKSTTTFSKLSELKTIDLYPDLLAQGKVAATWANVAIVFDTNDLTLSSELISFLSKDENAAMLGNIEEIEDEQKQLYDQLFSQLMNCNAISDSAYRTICSLIPNVYFEYEISLASVSRDKLAALCDTGALYFRSLSLDAVFNIDRAISVSFLEKNIDELEKSDEKFSISIRLVEYMVVSSSLSMSRKVLLINFIEPTELIAYTGSLDWLITFITDNPVPTVSATLLSHLINKESIRSVTRVKILQMYHLRLTSFNYKAFLETLGPMYASTFSYQQKTWDYNPANYWLAQKLKEQRLIQRVNKKGDKLKLTIE